MSKVKQYIEEQLEKGIDVLHPEYLYLQLEESYGNYLAENEKRETQQRTKQNETFAENDSTSCEIPF